MVAIQFWSERASLELKLIFATMGFHKVWANREYLQRAPTKNGPVKACMLLR